MVNYYKLSRRSTGGIGGFCLPLFYPREARLEGAHQRAPARSWFARFATCPCLLACYSPASGVVRSFRAAASRAIAHKALGAHLAFSKHAAHGMPGSMRATHDLLTCIHMQSCVMLLGIQLRLGLGVGRRFRGSLHELIGVAGFGASLTSPLTLLLRPRHLASSRSAAELLNPTACVSSSSSSRVVSTHARNCLHVRGPRRLSRAASLSKGSLISEASAQRLRAASTQPRRTVQ